MLHVVFELWLCYFSFVCFVSHSHSQSDRGVYSCYLGHFFGEANYVEDALAEFGLDLSVLFRVFYVLPNF